jgi:predicted N-acetyltransferase YhbS
MENKETLNSPVLLSKEHDRNSFDCGVLPLNDFLKKFAWQNQRKNSSRTYVATRGTKIVGYYTLSFGSVSQEESPENISAGLGKYPIPIVLLARLAVDISEKGKGLGKGLLLDAFRRSVQAAEIAGLRAFVVHAKDDSAKAFYQKFDFEPSPSNEYHLYLLISQIADYLSRVE